MIVIDVIRPDRLRRIMMFENGNVGHMVLIAGSGWSGNIERQMGTAQRGILNEDAGSGHEEFALAGDVRPGDLPSRRPAATAKRP